MFPTLDNCLWWITPEGESTGRDGAGDGSKIKRHTGNTIYTTEGEILEKTDLCNDR